MAIAYRLVKNNDASSAYNGQYYAKAVITDEITLEELSERVQRNCSMKKSDVYAVLTEFVEVLKDELQASHKIIVDGLGTFKIGIKGTYAKTVQAFNPSTNISGFRVNFRPEASRVKTGTYTDSEGVTRVKYAYISDLTNGATVQKY